MKFMLSNHDNERIKNYIKDYILLMLGAPAITVKLTPQQLDLIIKRAVANIRSWRRHKAYDYDTLIRMTKHTAIQIARRMSNDN